MTTDNGGWNKIYESNDSSILLNNGLNYNLSNTLAQNKEILGYNYTINQYGIVKILTPNFVIFKDSGYVIDGYANSNDYMNDIIAQANLKFYNNSNLIKTVTNVGLTRTTGADAKGLLLGYINDTNSLLFRTNWGTNFNRSILNTTNTTHYGTYSNIGHIAFFVR